jgi:hypothetical protein
MNIPMDVSTIKMTTSEKHLVTISKIANGTAYDQDGEVIPTRYFKAFPHVLSITFDRQMTVA